MQNYEQADFLLLGLARLVRSIPHIGALNIQVDQSPALARSTRFKINLVLLPLAFAGQQLDQKEIAFARVKAGTAVYRLNDLWEAFRGRFRKRKIKHAKPQLAHFRAQAAGA